MQLWQLSIVYQLLRVLLATHHLRMLKVRSGLRHGILRHQSSCTCTRSQHSRNARISC